MYLYNSFRWIVVFAMIILPSITLGQTLEPTASLSYPFNVQKSDGTWYQGHETMNRNQYSGYNFTEPATYNHPTQGYAYTVFHPAWDMNVIGFGGDGDQGQHVYAIADGIVIEPQSFDNGQSYNTPSAWNELAIEHDVGGKKWVTTYGHMQKIFVKAGDVVTAGQQVGEVGDVPDSDPGNPGNMGAHLHLEVRDPDNHPNVNYPGYWDSSKNTDPETSNQLHIMSNVESWYHHPELFIKGYPAIGRTRTGEHPNKEKWISTYRSHQEKKTGSDPWNKYQYWDQVTDRGNGDIYVHFWPDGSGDPNNPNYNDRIELQDLKNVKDDTYAAIIYNRHKDMFFYSDSTILGYWFSNTGYANYGPPATNQEKAIFVDLDSQSPYNTDTGKEMIRQSFSKQADGNMKTIVHIPSDSYTGYRPVGSFKQGDYNGQTGLLIYEYVNGVEKRWPAENTTVVTPTDLYFVPVRDHQFRLRDANGNLVHSFTFSPIEGNHQASGEIANNIPVSSVTAQVSGDIVILSWEDTNTPPRPPYSIKRDGQEIASITGTSYADIELSPGTYEYTITGSNISPSSIVYATVEDNSSNPPPSTDPAHLAVHVTPSNATVLLDGNPFTTSPDITNLQYYDITANVNHTLTASAPGYEDYTQSFASGIGDYRDEVIFLNPTDTGQSSTSTNSDSLVFNPIHDQQVDFKDPTYLHGGAYLQVNHDYIVIYRLSYSIIFQRRKEGIRKSVN